MSLVPGTSREENKSEQSTFRWGSAHRWISGDVNGQPQWLILG